MCVDMGVTLSGKGGVHRGVSRKGGSQGFTKTGVHRGGFT